MKLLTILTLFLGSAVALESAALEQRAEHPRKRAPKLKVEMRAASAAASHPAGYSTWISKPTLQRSKASLSRVSGLQQRSKTVEGNLPRQLQASDFFECTNPNPSPSTSDCKAIVSQVLSSNDELIIAANSCLVFSLGTCQGFFCSLCETLTTTTEFIGSQLDTVDALCVENGQAGTIVGEEAPQWDAGFTYAGEGLPTFDVC